MMRGLVIATNGDMRVQTFTAPALEDVQKVVGGYVETVPVRNIEGHYLLMVDEDARLQWPRPVVNEVASFLACTKIFGTVVLTSAYGPELGLPDDIAHVLGMSSWQRCRAGADGRVKHDPFAEKGNAVCLPCADAGGADGRCFRGRWRYAPAERRDPVHQLSAGRKYLPWNLVQAGR